MDQQRRTLTFFTLSLMILIAWSQFVIPTFFPPKPRPKPNLPDFSEFEFPVSALEPANVASDEAVPVKPNFIEHPPRLVTIGSADSDSKYLVKVELTSLGASVKSIVLSDPAYPEYGARGTQLTLLGRDPLADKRTFATQFPALSAQMDDKSLEDVHWQVVDGSESETGVEFRFTSPNGEIEIIKAYSLAKPEGHAAGEAKPEQVAGYELKLAIRMRNLSRKPQELTYQLRGPVGLPLEDPANSSKFRDVRLGFLQPGGDIDSTIFPATKAVAQLEKFEKEEVDVEVWKRPLQFIGVDTRYFAALIHPTGNQLKSPTIEAARADVVRRGSKPEYADVSVVLTSSPRPLAPQGAANQSDQLNDEFVLYAGPKRESLLLGIRAESVLDYGMFAPVVRLMLGILKFFHGMGFGYGFAIIGLTCLVRAAMFPVTRHQARSMDKMKDLQPRIKALHEKYKNDPSSLAPEEMRQLQEVQLKMMMGCLPLFLQMPIFIALYHALQVAIDLRMAPFHLVGSWVDNLASPDAMFQLPFAIPFAGWTEFNLLPIISVVLMIINQKLTMPPPADEEQEMQYKMMNVMMGVMVIFFYRVPAGLCLYFIASSIWGTSERLLLKKLAPTPAPGSTTTVVPAVSTPTPAPTTAPSAAPAKPSLFDGLRDKLKELQELADKQQTVKRDDKTPPKNSKKNRGRR